MLVSTNSRGTYNFIGYQEDWLLCHSMMLSIFRLPSRAKGTTRRPQSRPKTSPRCPQDAPKIPKDAPEATPRQPQDAQEQFFTHFGRFCDLGVIVGRICHNFGSGLAIFLHKLDITQAHSTSKDEKLTASAVAGTQLCALDRLYYRL